MQGPNARGQPGGDDDELIGTLVADRYRIVRRLGRGGMGTVYLAVHEKLRKEVAFKLLDVRAGSDEQAVARFHREAITSANLRHPNIVEASDFGRLPDGSLYLVMEYIDGKSAQALVNATPGGLPPERALRILRQVASALVQAHAAGVVHRDLKPENILVFDRGDERDVVKVIDFGIARIRSAMLGAGASITVAGAVFGTPEYMAPEQVLGQPADARADQYAFGVTAFELLTGRVPYTDTDLSRLFTKHLSAPIPSAQESAPHLPPAACEVLARLLAKRPEDRYASIAEAYTALEASLAGAGAAPATPASGTVRLDAWVPVPPASPALPPASVNGPVPASTYRPASTHWMVETLARRAVTSLGRARTLADRATATAKKSPVIAGGVGFAGLLATLLVITVIVHAASSSLPPGVEDALHDWEDGAYSQAAPKLRAELGKDPALAADPAVVGVIVSALEKPEGRSALPGLLDETGLGRSPVMAAALAKVAQAEVSGARNGALRLLRGRGDLLPAEERARVAYRDAEDCAALAVAVDALARVGTANAKADLDSHRGGRCAEVIRREELCGCTPGPAGRGKKRSPPR